MSRVRLLGWASMLAVVLFGVGTVGRLAEQGIRTAAGIAAIGGLVLVATGAVVALWLAPRDGDDALNGAILFGSVGAGTVLAVAVEPGQSGFWLFFIAALGVVVYATYRLLRTPAPGSSPAIHDDAADARRIRSIRPRG